MDKDILHRINANPEMLKLLQEVLLLGHTIGKTEQEITSKFVAAFKSGLEQGYDQRKHEVLAEDLIGIQRKQFPKRWPYDYTIEERRLILAGLEANRTWEENYNRETRLIKQRNVQAKKNNDSSPI